MKAGKIFACVFGAAALLSGCMTDETIQKNTADPRIALVNSSSYSVRLLSSNSFIDDNGFLTVNAQTLLSRTSAWKWIFCGDPKVTVYFRMDFLDGKGRVCSSKVSEIMALPGNIVDFQGVAASEKYLSYKLTVSLEKLDPVPVAAPAKKAAVKKAPAKKVAVKKAPAKKAAVKKAPAKKVAVKKAPAKKVAVKKVPAKKAAVKKAPAKKVAVKKAPAKQAAVKKAPAKKVAVKKAPAKQTPAKKVDNVKLTEPFN